MCEKCRLMELLDRELERWDVYHGSKPLANALHLYAIERRDRVIAEAREKEDREMYEQPDPLAEWKALKPGRKVLEIETFTVLTVKKAYSNGIHFYGDWIGYDRLTDKRAYQLLHEGPFDAWKLKVGDWVWNTLWDKWVTFEGYADQCNIVPTFKDPETGNRYCYYSRYTHYLSFSPPTPPSREERIGKATEKIWHLIDRAANQSTVAKEEAHAILTELMEGKP